ncbi:hypothetical protein ACPRNU_20485 [Chromobacterium vaccinii]|uniref:hypothetical protein n=1 Tax=Chromobacterium vaccinii TaxID=1108595 RepID=UPI003C789EF9
MTDVTKETLDLMKAAVQDVNKTVTLNTGLVGYDLSGPAKNLYPVLTPLRNKIPRVPGGFGAATNWKVIMGLNGSGVASMPWVPEGQRSGRMNYQAVPKAANYVTFGEEDGVTFESDSASAEFENVRATSGVRLLQQTMIKEEKAILGGNASVALGAPAAPVVSAYAPAGLVATLPAGDYSVIVAALTFEGIKVASLAGGVITSRQIKGADGQTYTLNGGVSNKSTSAVQGVTIGQALAATVQPVNGALGYAWFVGSAGKETLQAITTLNSAVFSAPLASGRQPASVLTADFSTNPGMAFDGLLYSAFNPASSAYIVTMPTGPAGQGTPLTSGGRGNVVEIDNMLQGMWDTYRLGATIIYVNSQEATSITSKVMTSAQGTLLRYNSENSGSQPYRVTGSGVVDSYFNPYVEGGGRIIPIVIHPDLPPGTIVARCENLPVSYQNSEIQNVVEMKMRRDYYQIDWPLRTRMYEMGVYAEGVLANYAPFAMGVITNIGND